jgi:hypothetical protein
MADHLPAEHPVRCASCGDRATTTVVLEGVRVPACLRHYNHWRTPTFDAADPECPPRPDRPEPGTDEDGYPAVPEGWSSVVCGIDPGLPDDHAPVVLCGWDAGGTFHQYAPTEAIVTVCVEALQEAHRG